MVYIFDFIYWSQNIKNVGVRPARHRLRLRRGGRDQAPTFNELILI